MMAPDYGAAPAKNPSGGAGLTGNAGTGSKTRQPTRIETAPDTQATAHSTQRAHAVDPTLQQRGGGMSDQTLQAVHDAIAAHIADVNEDDPEFLTEWVFVASTAISTSPDESAYYIYDSNIPRHHALGLLQYARLTVSADIGSCDN